MVRATGILVLVAFVLYPEYIVVSVSTSECVVDPQNCDVLGNVTGSKDVIQQINTTLKAIEEVTQKTQCLSAVRNLMCVAAVRSCNNSSQQFNKSSMCDEVQKNCTTIVFKVYGGRYNCSNNSINNSECLDIDLASNSYCPNNDTYKIEAKNVGEFLEKASMEKENIQTAQIGNTSCLTEYKRIKCKSFVPTCTEKEGNTITKEICEEGLQCLQSNASFNKEVTNLCSSFSSVPSTKASTTPASTAPYDFTMGYNTTVTTRLKTKYNSKYSNKSSSLYKSFADEVTDGLEMAYEKIRGFKGVFITELTCQEEVAVKHTVVTSTKPNVKVMEARLILANITSGGYLEGKVVEANRVCGEDDHDHDHDDHDNHDDHLESNNWVYMIVFVCVTALLLLAMVLCHQSK